MQLCYYAVMLLCCYAQIAKCHGSIGPWQSCHWIEIVREGKFKNYLVKKILCCYAEMSLKGGRMEALCREIKQTLNQQAGKNVHWSDLWPIWFGARSLWAGWARPPRQWVWPAQAENHQLKICDVIGCERGDRGPAWLGGGRQRCLPLWFYFQLLSLNIKRQSQPQTQFIGSQDWTTKQTKLEQIFYI